MASITYVRFLRSGMTWAGTVRRLGHVLAIPVEQDPDGVLAKTEKEQRSIWGDAFYESLTKAEYEDLAGEPSVAPEHAARVQTPAPPGTDGDVVRGGGPQRGVAEPGHTEPAAVTPPPEPTTNDTPDTPERWGWYEGSDVGATLAKVADMAEVEAVEFLAFEQSNKARKGVIGPMTGQ